MTGEDHTGEDHAGKRWTNTEFDCGFYLRKMEWEGKREQDRSWGGEKVAEACCFFRRTAEGRERLGVSRACLLKGPLHLHTKFLQLGPWVGQGTAGVHPAI